MYIFTRILCIEKVVLVFRFESNVTNIHFIQYIFVSDELFPINGWFFMTLGPGRTYCTRQKKNKKLKTTELRVEKYLKREIWMGFPIQREVQADKERH